MTNGALPAEGRRSPVSDDDGVRSVRLLSMLSLLLAVAFAPAGAVLAAVALVRSRRIGYRNPIALVAVIYGAAVTLVALLAIALAAWWGFSLFGPAFETCRELGRGIWEIDGVLYRCNV